MKRKWIVEVFPHEGFGISIDGKEIYLTDDNASEVERLLNKAEEMEDIQDRVERMQK